jgi:hypothetical protein
MRPGQESLVMIETGVLVQGHSGHQTAPVPRPLKSAIASNTHLDPAGPSRRARSEGLSFPSQTVPSGPAKVGSEGRSLF